MIRVSNIQRFATHDGPGIRTTVFLKGCPLHCPWCSNPETWKYEKVIMHDERKCVRCQSCLKECDREAISFTPEFHLDYRKCNSCGKCVEVCLPDALSINGKDMTVEEIVAEAAKDIDYYRNSDGGVTLSGGEPLFQGEEVIELLRKLKGEGYHVALETTGMYEGSRLEKVLPYVDLFLFDVKHVDKKKLKEYTGGDLKDIETNLDYLSKHCADKVIARTPVIPGFNRDDVYEIIDFVKAKGIKEIDLLPYHSFGKNKWHDLQRQYAYEELKTMDKSELAEYVEYGKRNGITVKLGG